MQEAYERYKKFHPESTITFEEWVSIKYTTPPEVISNLQPNIPPYISDDFQIGPDGAFEYEDDLKDWDNTLNDGLEDE